MNGFEKLLEPAGLVAAGAILAKVLDWALARKKTDLDAVSARFEAINEGQKRLVEGLFQQVKSLQEEVAGLKQSLAHCEAQHREAQKRQDDLQSELIALKSTLRPH